MASLGANRKEKPYGEISARVLFDGTHGLSVNRRTRARDQERAPFASDLKRAVREKSKLGELTLTLSADISEAHRQVPTHPQDWHHLGCQVNEGLDVFVHSRGHIWSIVGVVFLVPGCGINRKACTVLGGRSLHDLAYAGGGRVYAGVWRTTSNRRTPPPGGSPPHPIF